MFQYISPEPAKRSPASRLCPLCPASCVTKSETLAHFRGVHGREIKTKTFEFADENSFDEWKLRYEDETKSKFVKYNCYRSKVNSIRVFVCHRSGCFQSKSKGFRRQRLHGSEKINGYCPAEIKLTVWHDTQRHQVQYVDEHVGHGQDLQFLKLPEPPVEADECEDLSLLKLSAGTPLTPDDKRLTDTIVLTTWINENFDSVLYFKGQETVDHEFPELKSGADGDFVFVIMNDFQTDMFKQYAKDAVAVGRMDGPVGYGLHFFVVMVMDNYMQGIPCCFMLSNRNDRYVYETLFRKMSEQVGKVETRVFMSEPVQVYADAWCDVMPAPERRLWCSWTVVRYWDAYLSKIGNAKLRRRVRRHLFAVRKELNPFRFHELLRQLLDERNAELREFQRLFELYFAENESFWAYCHRKHAGMNTNYITEHFFKTFRRTYLRKKSQYSVEEGLDALSKLLKVLCFEKIVREVRGKLVSKIKILRLRHAQCMEEAEKKLDEIQRVSGDRWLLSSFVVDEEGTSSEMENNGEDSLLPNVELYEVERVSRWCDCKLRCLECKSCLHEYRCSCIDNCIQYNMCVHIHLVCTLINRTQVRENDDLIEVLEVNEVEPADDIEEIDDEP